MSAPTSQHTVQTVQTVQTGNTETPRYRVTFGRIVRSEWTKLRSLRSTWLTIGSTAALTIVLAGLFGWAYRRAVDDGAVQPATADAAGLPFAGMDLPTLVFGILGVLLVTGEYGSGLIRASLAAVPRRVPMLLAKVVVFAGCITAVMIAVSFVAFFVSQAFLGEHAVSVGEDGVLRAVVGSAWAVAGFGLLGVALGVLVRHTAGAITAYVGMILVPPLLTLPLPERVADAVSPYLPPVAAGSLHAIGDGDGGYLLSPGIGAMVLAGYATVLLAAGAIVLRYRDA